MLRFNIERSIGIDAGHRVCTHGSKCFNMHGHRYEIIAAASAENLPVEGEESGMVMDFGFLKDIMMDTIDKHYDHAFIVWEKDKELLRRLAPGYSNTIVDRYDHDIEITPEGCKLCVVPCNPTAENLAELWFRQLEGEMPNNGARLEYVKVWETPNCMAQYPYLSITE